MLSSLLLSTLREQFPNRDMVTGEPPKAVVVFPGVHPGIRQVSIFDDGHELTLAVDDLTHGHFSTYDDSLPEAERNQWIVDSVVEFLDDLFADRMAVWGQHDVGGGWYHIEQSQSNAPEGVPVFVWSGPLT